MSKKAFDKIAEGLHDAVARGEAAPASCRVKIDGRRGNYGVVFTDLPGCTAMEALHHAMEAAAEWAEVKSCPCPQIELTMRQAADLLCVSQPFLAYLLGEGKLVATHRRIRLEDVLRYKASIDTKRRKVLDELVAEAQELNIVGYAKPPADVRNSEEGN